MSTNSKKEQNEQLDLADAQLIGFKHGKWNWDGIVDLVEGMGMTKKEWEKWKENYPNILDDADFEAVEKYFEKHK
jgi:hypothetical protein